MIRLMHLFQNRAIVVWGITILVAGLSIPLNSTVYADDAQGCIADKVSQGKRISIRKQISRPACLAIADPATIEEEVVK